MFAIYRSWKVARMVIRGNDVVYTTNNLQKTHFEGWIMTKCIGFQSQISDFAENFSIFRSVGAKWVQGVPPNLDFHKKTPDLSVSEFRSILDDPQILNKQYYVSSEKSRKKNFLSHLNLKIKTFLSHFWFKSFHKNSKKYFQNQDSYHDLNTI